MKEVTLHASIRQGTVHPGQVKDFIRVLNEEIAPAHAQIKGFVAYYAVDCGDDRLMGISLFEDRAGADKASEQATAYAGTKLRPFLAKPLDIATGEVVVEKVPQHV